MSEPVESKKTQTPATLRTGDAVEAAEPSAHADPGASTPNRLAGRHVTGLHTLGALAAHAERRMRFGRALAAFAMLLFLGIVGAVVIVALAKTGKLDDHAARRWLTGLASLPLLGAIAGWFRPLPPLAGAVALDRQAGLADRIATALTFGKDPAPTPFMLAAIEDAIAAGARANPRAAVAIPFPDEAVAALVASLFLAGVSVLEVRKHVPIAVAPTIDAVELAADDVEALAEFANQLKDTPHADEEMRQAVEQFNKLVEDLKNRRIDRNEAFRQMALLDTKLQKGGELDKKALEEALKKVGNDLKKNDLTKEVGAALEKGDKKEAEKKLKELAQKLKNKELKLSEEQKKALAEALKKAASRDREKALAEMKDKRDKLLAEMEKARAEKDKNGGKENAEQEKERKNRERELERLDREEREQKSADRQLEKLDRDLQQAAADIMKDLGLSAADIDAGAEDVNRMAEDDMTAEEKEELRQRLKELHDLLVQQGKLTPEQMQKLKEFMKKARGGKNGKSGKSKSGKGKKPGKFVVPEDDPNAGDGKDGDDGGDGKDGDDGDGKDGDGKDGAGKKPGEGWTLGPDGKPIPIPGSGAGSSGKPGGGEPSRGPGWGTGHDPKMLGRATTNKVGTADTQIAGQNAGDGPKRSEVILGAADKGFTGRGYKKVYDQYKTVAEEALKQDEIPAGYRFYVRRYFDLIRPRE
jgi:hypothetical protein